MIINHNENNKDILSNLLNTIVDTVKNIKDTVFFFKTIFNEIFIPDGVTTATTIPCPPCTSPPGQILPLLPGHPPCLTLPPGPTCIKQQPIPTHYYRSYNNITIMIRELHYLQRVDIKTILDSEGLASGNEYVDLLLYYDTDSYVTVKTKILYEHSIYEVLNNDYMSLIQNLGVKLNFHINHENEKSNDDLLTKITKAIQDITNSVE
jgi:hypothetical protein